MGLSDRTRWAYRKLGLHDGPTTSYLADAGLTPYVLVDELTRHTTVGRPPLRYLPPSLARRRFMNRVRALDDEHLAMLASLDDHTKWQGLTAPLAVYCAFEGLDDRSLVAELQYEIFGVQLIQGGAISSFNPIPLILIRTLLNGQHVDTLRQAVRQRLSEPFRALSPSQEAGLEVSADEIRVFLIPDAPDEASLEAFLALGGEPDLLEARNELLAVDDPVDSPSILFNWLFTPQYEAVERLTRTSVTTLEEALTVREELEELNNLVARLQDACEVGLIHGKYNALLE